MNRNIAGEESDSNKEKKCVYLECKSTQKKACIQDETVVLKEKMNVLVW